MLPYGDRFGGARLIPSDFALDRIASSVRPSFTLITPTGVLPGQVVQLLDLLRGPFLAAAAA